MTSVAVVIVTYNNRDTIIPCLQSLSRSLADYDSRVVVIDNNSDDNTPGSIIDNTPELDSIFRRFQLVINNKNLGFTRAVNQGLKKVEGDYYLLLNPDVELLEATMSNLMACFRKFPQSGAVAPQLRFSDGTIQSSCRRFPTKMDVLYEVSGLTRMFPKHPDINRWKMSGFDHLHGHDVEQPQGAFLLIKKKVLDQVGFLDEQFEMFFSDVDYCKRIVDLGWRIRFCPEAVAVHHKGHSVYRNKKVMIKSSHQSFVDYFKKYDENLSDRLGTAFVALLLNIAMYIRLIVAR